MSSCVTAPTTREAPSVVAVARRLGAAFLFCLAAGGCGGGGNGDPHPIVEGNVLGGGNSIASLADPSKLPRPSTTQLTTVTGVRVTCVDNFDETKSGSAGTVYLQDFTDAPGPFQGISTHAPSYSPPSFRVVPGDVVDATGQYQEFQLNLSFLKPGWTTPQLSSPNLTLRFDAPYRPLLSAEISLNDLVDYSTGRQWLSMLVTVKNVVVLEDYAESKGRGAALLTVEGAAKNVTPTLSNELFDVGGSGLSLKAGTVIASLTGVVTLFDVFHIAPRSVDDIQLNAQ